VAETIIELDQIIDWQDYGVRKQAILKPPRESNCFINGGAHSSRDVYPGIQNEKLTRTLDSDRIGVAFDSNVSPVCCRDDGL
jgi:hypothetical protein